MPTAPQRLYITEQAIQVIEEEARRFAHTQGSGHETGGILIGRRLPDQPHAVLILSATGPGEHALRTPVEFAPDVHYVNQQMIAARALYPRIDYIGTWHKHPPDYRTFSPGDVRTAHGIFQDPSYIVDEIINPIVWVEPAGAITAHYYYMSRVMAERGEAFVLLDGAAVEVIPDNHQLVEREYRVSSTSTDRLSPAWVHDESGRLQDRGYAVRVRRKRERQEYLLIVTHPVLPGVTIIFVASEGYPRERPQIFIEGTGRSEPLNSEEAYTDLERRRGRVHLVDIADELVTYLRRRGHGNGQAPLAGPLAVALSRDDEPPAVPSLDEPSASLLSTADDLTPGRRPAPRLWMPIVLGLLLIVLVPLGLLLRPRTAPLATPDYMAIWSQIDAALAQPSEAGLRGAIAELEDIRIDDPDGVVLARNIEVTDTLVLAYTMLGDQLYAMSPPDLDGADDAFIVALSLSPQDPTAQAGRGQVRVSLKATAAASAQQEEIARRWQNVDAASDLELQISLLQALLADGVTSDPDGVPTAQRLEQALQAAADAQASQLIAEAEGAVQQGDWEAALDALRAVAQIDPPPSTALRTTASDQLRQIEAQLSEAELFFQQTWAAYDLASAEADFAGAIDALDALVQRTNEPLPDPKSFSTDRYDERTAQVGLLLVDARLSYAGSLQRAGMLTEAEVQYRMIEPVLQTMEQSRRLEGEVATRRSNYQGQVAEFARGQQHWNVFNQHWIAGKLAQARAELNELARLATFGPQAINPNEPKQSVNALLARIHALLNPPPSPTAVPTVAPAPSPAPPVEQHTSEPTIDPNSQPPAPPPTPQG